MNITRLLFAMSLLLPGTVAFVPMVPKARTTTLPSVTEGVVSDLPPFPTDEPFKRIQGGGTVMTWPMPTDAERVEMMFRSSGRPMKVTGEKTRESEREKGVKSQLVYASSRVVVYGSIESVSFACCRRLNSHCRRHYCFAPFCFVPL